MKTTNMQKFIGTACEKIRTPRGLAVALIAALLIGMGGQKIISNLKDDKKRDRVKAEIENYLADQPNYIDSIAAISELYDKDISEVYNKILSNYSFSDYGHKMREEFEKFIFGQLNPLEKNKLKNTVTQLYGSTMGGYEPYELLQFYYHLYSSGQIGRDNISKKYERSASYYVDCFRLPAVIRPDDMNAVKRYLKQQGVDLSVFDFEVIFVGVVPISHKIITFRKNTIGAKDFAKFVLNADNSEENTDYVLTPKWNKLKKEKAKSISNFVAAQKKLDEKNKKHIDSVYAENKLKRFTK